MKRLFLIIGILGTYEAISFIVEHNNSHISSTYWVLCAAPVSLLAFLGLFQLIAYDNKRVNEAREKAIAMDKAEEERIAREDLPGPWAQLRDQMRQCEQPRMRKQMLMRFCANAMQEDVPKITPLGAGLLLDAVNGRSCSVDIDGLSEKLVDFVDMIEVSEEDKTA